MRQDRNDTRKNTYDKKNTYFLRVQQQQMTAAEQTKEHEDKTYHGIKREKMRNVGSKAQKQDIVVGRETVFHLEHRYSYYTLYSYQSFWCIFGLGRAVQGQYNPIYSKFPLYSGNSKFTLYYGPEWQVVTQQTEQTTQRHIMPWHWIRQAQHTHDSSPGIHLKQGIRMRTKTNKEKKNILRV